MIDLAAILVKYNGNDFWGYKKTVHSEKPETGSQKKKILNYYLILESWILPSVRSTKARHQWLIFFKLVFWSRSSQKNSLQIFTDYLW